MNAVRSVVVPALLVAGSLVLIAELFSGHRLYAVLALVAGAVLLALLPRPVDVRSGVYAFFVPIAMVYGAVMQQYVLALFGVIAGVSFLVEKTAATKNVQR